MPLIKNENPQLSPYRHLTLQRNDDWGFASCTTILGDDSLIGGSSSSLDTIRPPINHENPQLLPYPSSTTLQSNGSIYNASFMTSPSDDSFIEVPNYIAEACQASPSTLRRPSTPSSAVEPSPRSPTPLSPEPFILPTPAGNAAPTGPVPYRIWDTNKSYHRGSSPSTIKVDKYAFIKYMNNIGRAYRKQAMELVSISRLFVQFQNQTFGSNADRNLGM